MRSSSTLTSWVPLGKSLNSCLVFFFSGKLRILIYLLPVFQYYSENQRNVIYLKEFCQIESTVKTVKHFSRGWINPCGIEFNSLSHKPSWQCDWRRGERGQSTGGQYLLLWSPLEHQWKVRGRLVKASWVEGALFQVHFLAQVLPATFLSQVSEPSYTAGLLLSFLI